LHLLKGSRHGNVLILDFLIRPLSPNQRALPLIASWRLLWTI
jgi:hypothetical protein